MEQEFQMDLDDDARSLSPNTTNAQPTNSQELDGYQNSGDTEDGITKKYHSDDEMLDEVENLDGDGEENGYVDGYSGRQENEKDGIVRKGKKIKVLKNLDGGLLRYDSVNNVDDFFPPENFSPVVGQIYRSSFPRAENFTYLKKLHLKTILFLVPEEYPEENLKFAKENNINVFQVSMSGNKEPFVKIPDDVLTEALKIAINPANHPLLIHCNRGKHRTGCLVGCIRRLQNWSLSMILDEYRRFAAPKIRPLDQQFIELYNDGEITKIANANGWLPIEW
jgi:tyrosine-protein phosphatase SIW14